MKNFLFGLGLVLAAAYVALALTRRRAERDAEIWARETDSVG
ncbi:MAG: hypothetical protein WAS07_09700 [Micropruina sp.]